MSLLTKAMGWDALADLDKLITNAKRDTDALIDNAGKEQCEECEQYYCGFEICECKTGRFLCLECREETGEQEIL